MKKYRIVEENGYFYPQYLGWFLWFDVWKYFYKYQTEFVDGCDGLGEYTTFKQYIKFDTFRDAQEYIYKNKTIIHEID